MEDGKLHLAPFIAWYIENYRRQKPAAHTTVEIADEDEDEVEERPLVIGHTAVSEHTGGPTDSYARAQW